MIKELKIRAYKALIVQAKYDIADVRAKYKAYWADPKNPEVEKIVPPFTAAYVVGSKIFLTEDAVEGWSVRRGELVEEVYIEDAFEYADENPDFLEAIHSMYLSSYMKRKENEQSEDDEDEEVEA